MQIRTDRGWIKAGLAVLVTGALGGGVMAAAGGSKPPRKVTADGVTGKATPPAPASKGFDLAAVAPAGAEPAPEPKADPKVGDKVTVGDDGGSVTVSAVEDNVSAGRLFGAGEGQKYIAAEVKGCSGPHEKNLSFEPAYFLLKLDDGTMHDPGPPAKKPSLQGGTVPAGKCLSGWVTFVVKDGSLPTAVVYDGSSRLTWTVPLPKNAKPTTTTTLKAGAATPPTYGADGAGTTTSTKPKTTATTAKSTATTGKSTATTGKSTPATGKSTPATGKSTPTTGKSTPTTARSASTTTTTKPTPTTTTTGRSGSATTPSTSGGKGGSTTTTTKPGPPITTPG